MDQNIRNVHVGSEVSTIWKVCDDKYEWFSGVVVKIHRRTSEYVVCKIKYNDGDIQNSEVLNEKDYGVEWTFPMNECDSETESTCNEFENSYQPNFNDWWLSSLNNTLKYTNRMLFILMVSNLCMVSPMFMPTIIPIWNQVQEQIKNYI